MFNHLVHLIYLVICYVFDGYIMFLRVFHVYRTFYIGLICLLSFGN